MTDPIYIFTRGLWRLREEVAVLSGLAPRRAFVAAGSQGAVAGWGHKPTSARARAEARRRKLPYIAFEDGFLRSLRPGPAQKPVAMIIDRSGIYYDARQPSDLETLLAASAFTETECRMAADVIAAIAARRLSKYNHGHDRLDGLVLPAAKPVVLLIDQTAGDESIAGGLADASRFRQMVDCAVAENPGATLIAKLHPEVISGTKTGYLRGLAGHCGIRLLASDCTPWALLDLRPRVYTVSSQFGFEALLAGCAVSCFGAPFYAGWGLTDDRAEVPRRTRHLTLPELAAGVYLRYCRYFDAWRRTPTDVMTAIDQLDFLRRGFLANATPVIGYRIARWKRRAVSAMLDGPHGPPTFTSRLPRAIDLAKQRRGAIAAWGMTAARLRDNADCAGVPCLAVEDGFIRSAGLGATFVQPLSLVFDGRGIYYDPSRPSDIEHLLAQGEIGPADISRARLLRERIVAEKVTKYNLAGEAPAEALPADREIVLVPGQVADDAAVLAGAAAGMPAPDNINADLLTAARRRNSDAYVIFKPHPDVEHLGRRGALSSDQERLGADRVARKTSIEALLPLVTRLETHSSLSGFEALLRGLPVTVHGMPFYAGWGLTGDMVENPRRGRRRSLDEVVAAALICYPRYWDPPSGLSCPPELALDRLGDMRHNSPARLAGFRRLAGRSVILWRKLTTQCTLKIPGSG